MKLMFFFLFGLLCFCITGMPLTSAAQDVNGEIINVNPQLQVAFVNLNKNDVSLGDIVSIYQQMRFIGYLQVVGTSDAVSKLTVVNNVQGKNLNPIDFNAISVGDIVKKESLPLESLDNPISNFPGTSSVTTLEPIKVPDSSPSEDNVYKYMQILHSIDDMRAGQKNLEEELARTKAKLDDTLSHFNQAVAQNIELERENNKLITQIQGLQEEKMKYLQEAVQWRQKFSDEQKRLGYISDMLNKNINND